MAITLIVEDGTIVAGANSYVSLASATTYLDNWYPTTSGTWDSATVAQQTVALASAAYAMDRLYGRKYLSILPPASTQAMLWPRFTFMDNTYRLISNGQIPQCIKDAQCELAFVYLQGVSLFPNETDNRLYKNTQVDVGVKINQTYWEKPKDVEHYDGFRKIELILFPVLEQESNSRARLSL